MEDSVDRIWRRWGLDWGWVVVRVGIIRGAWGMEEVIYWVILIIYSP